MVNLVIVMRITVKLILRFILFKFKEENVMLLAWIMKEIFILGVEIHMVLLDLVRR
eukprot:CAMPEP_0117050582 /NCGR_PEP_ID=MMETSP0472-20121206/34932_1 /TAXON_ID=693140 ORGANISM="Tiarina fusus, Strain LIS" /NCGR_SAMPLE_ID=MMETSP0472 /ASSEMBLY_ACC=CAM_ASM_000603 /LENGTH=55 /DNA_ID=CAMNT_0004764435 /DNA_START=379 /DNA_END=546 /DNA_ORIENTATION=-